MVLNKLITQFMFYLHKRWLINFFAQGLVEFLNTKLHLMMVIRIFIQNVLKILNNWHSLFSDKVQLSNFGIILQLMIDMIYFIFWGQPWNFLGIFINK